MLIRDHLPELGTDLVAALAGLDVHELAHGCCSERGGELLGGRAAQSAPRVVLSRKLFCMHV